MALGETCGRVLRRQWRSAGGGGVIVEWRSKFAAKGWGEAGRGVTLPQSFLREGEKRYRSLRLFSPTLKFRGAG